ncbi:MAG: hypothetical protein IJK97_05765 [Thermoguttaceae bacterium]|nr:hypothetical protein [Thermoguttaceae bacterium]
MKAFPLSFSFIFTFCFCVFAFIHVPVLWAQDWLGPCDVALSHDGQILFTACFDSAEILKTETRFDSVFQRIPLPASPTGFTLSRDGNRLFVTCDPNAQSLLPTRPAPTLKNPALLCLDAQTGETLWQAEVGEGPQSPVLDPDETRVYLCARFQNRVEVVDVEKHAITAKIPMEREPFACAVSPDGKTLVVSNLLIDATTADEYWLPGHAALVDTETLETRLVEFPNGTINMRGVCVSPDGQFAYVLHSMGSYAIPTGQVKGGWINMNAVSFINLQTGEREGTLTLDHLEFAAANPWGITCSKDGRWLVISHAGTMEVSVIDRVAMHPHFLSSLAPYPSIGATPDHAGDLIPVQRRVCTSGKGPRAVTIGEETGENGQKRLYAYAACVFSDSVDRILIAENPFNTGRTIQLNPNEAIPRPTLARQGESLFNDGFLCFEHWQSCATSHPDARSDALNWDLLNDGSGTPKNTKSLLYAHFTAPAMATGVRENAEAAVRKGVELIHFTEPREKDALAMDAYLSALKARKAPILREAEENPEVNASIQRGRRLFFGPKTQCASCHTGEFYTDCRLHRVGTETAYETRPLDTPTLRECWRTAPYLHDGRFRTIFDLLKDGKHGFTAPLTDSELRDLEAFVLSL